MAFLPNWRTLGHLAGVLLLAFSAQPPSPRPGATHRVQVYRAGPGEPRDRAAPTSPRLSSPIQDKGRTRPYQIVKPGDGAPKGTPFLPDRISTARCGAQD